MEIPEPPCPTNEPTASPLLLGVLGGGCAQPGKANLRLIRRALRGGWDIPEAKRATLVEHLAGVFGSGHARNSIAAFRCLIEIDRVNERKSGQR